MAADILRRARLVRREIFDPTNPEHIESFKVFLRTNSWGAIQFYPEDPYTEAPATVMSKFARHQLSVEVESLEERTARNAARGVLQMQPIVRDEGRLARANEIMARQLGEQLGLPQAA